jgi:4-amino-4-deoxy-L-arabinose transferase-like glycosyltransferase
VRGLRGVRACLGVLRRVPAAGWVCGLVACLNAMCWSIVSPPFQVPDEPSHFAYVQLLAQSARLPPPSSEISFSPEEKVALEDLHHAEVRWHPEHGTISTSVEQNRLQEDLARRPPRSPVGAVGVSASEPPLYYALETVPYRLASSGSILDQLALMRLLSAMMAGLTGLFAYLFAREALPSARWAWTVGGLAVAVTPTLGMMSGAVNPDAMLAAVSAAIFYCLARGFRRGLTRKLALVLGTLTAVGFLTKLNFIGLAPGLLLGFLILFRRGARGSWRGALRAYAPGLALAVSPVCAYALINLLSGHRTLGIVSGVVGGDSLLNGIGYVWQFYLPRLPGMTRHFPGISTTIGLWFDRSVGLYGWLDTRFPTWVYELALIPTGLTGAFLVGGLLAARDSLRERIGELCVYAASAVGLLALIGATAYITRSTEGPVYAQFRYLLPLLPMIAAALALAARGARRYGPAIGVIIVLISLTHDILSQLQVIARFYG